MNQLHDYLGFLDERIRRGAMLPAALSRAASIVRQLPPEHRAVFVGLRGVPSPLLPNEDRSGQRSLDYP